MPLEKGTGRKVRNRNIAKMIGEGYPPPQAVAASYEQERDSRREHKRRGIAPEKA